MMIESFEKHGSGRRSLSWNLVHLKPAGKFESLVQFVVMSNLKTLSIHNANFEFCDKYNSYALNRFRSVADDWLTVEDPGDYVATVAVIENVAEVRSLGGQTILRQDVSRCIELCKLRAMVQFESRRRAVRFVTRTGDLLRKSLFKVVLTPGMDLGEMQGNCNKRSKKELVGPETCNRVAQKGGTGSHHQKCFFCQR